MATNPEAAHATEPRAVRFTLPLPPSWVAQEVRGHPMHRHRLKQRYLREGLIALRTQLGRVPVFFRADYRTHFRVKARHDPDNLTRLLKWPLDLLVHVGMVRDDRDAYCRPIALPTQSVLPRVRSRKRESPDAYLKRRWARDAQVGIEFLVVERDACGPRR